MWGFRSLYVCLILRTQQQLLIFFLTFLLLILPSHHSIWSQYPLFQSHLFFPFLFIPHSIFPHLLPQTDLCQIGLTALGRALSPCLSQHPSRGKKSEPQGFSLSKLLFKDECYSLMTTMYGLYLTALKYQINSALS